MACGFLRNLDELGDANASAQKDGDDGSIALVGARVADETPLEKPRNVFFGKNAPPTSLVATSERQRREKGVEVLYR